MEHDHSDAVVGDLEVVSQESSASGASLEETSLRCLKVETERQGPADSERPAGDLHPLTLGDILASLPAQPQASRKNRRSGLNFVYEEEGKLPTQPQASRQNRRSGLYFTYDNEGCFVNSVAQASKPVSDKHWRFKEFRHAELVLATTNFSDDKKTGEGEFGSVFSGYLSDLVSAVAVKKISRGAIKEFVRELRDINKLLWHENLLELIGWSCRSGELLLVSEFMPNGSLHAHLFAKKRTLTWTIRYKIALQLASVLLYLHEEWEPPLVHGDVKSSNVMLDSDFNAKLGDFGMNRLMDNDHDEVGSRTTMIPMTVGYLAPEYISSRRASAESDVYSFGVVALEIASGRKAFETGENPTMGLVEKIWNLYENGRLLEAADGRLCMDFDTKEMECLIIVGLWCAHPDYKLRPSMRQVIAALQFEAEMPSLPNRMPVAMYMGSSSSAHSSQHSITTSSIP
ncbi:Serine/threonine protein kinase [Cinnamomum micranthum f. kanehirae]|uniref:Serine/threonine protein kinase n=1 Tax=Cinnamomum micranthum f. kanehirae TaxID=337451 RepID=A0A3S3NS16_9MAGN|nr:Serine/threonine protein kinase [Cinnamomum micranthum f. kanehirae]